MNTANITRTIETGRSTKLPVLLYSIILKINAPIAVASINIIGIIVYLAGFFLKRSQLDATIKVSAAINRCRAGNRGKVMPEKYCPMLRRNIINTVKLCIRRGFARRVDFKKPYNFLRIEPVAEKEQ